MHPAISLFTALSKVRIEGASIHSATYFETSKLIQHQRHQWPTAFSAAIVNMLSVTRLFVDEAPVGLGPGVLRAFA